MPMPDKVVFDMESPITSVILDKEDFDDLIDSLASVLQEDTKRTGRKTIERIKKSKALPTITRGLNTERVFNKFGIETDLAYFIVRGTSKMRWKEH